MDCEVKCRRLLDREDFEEAARLRDRIVKIDPDVGTANVSHRQAASIRM